MRTERMNGLLLLILALSSNACIVTYQVEQPATMETSRLPRKDMTLYYSLPLRLDTPRSVAQGLRFVGAWELSAGIHGMGATRSWSRCSRAMMCSRRPLPPPVTRPACQRPILRNSCSSSPFGAGRVPLQHSC